MMFQIVLLLSSHLTNGQRGGQDIGSVTTGGSSGPHLLPPVVSLCLKSLLFSMRFGAYHQPLNPPFNHQLL